MQECYFYDSRREVGEKQEFCSREIKKDKLDYSLLKKEYYFRGTLKLLLNILGENDLAAREIVHKKISSALEQNSIPKILKYSRNYNPTFLLKTDVKKFS